MVERSCLIEPYRNPPGIAAIESCLLKRLWVVSQMRRQGQVPLKQTPRLWIISPTFSSRLLALLGATPESNWPAGIYLTPRLYQSAIGFASGRRPIVVVHQLPVTPDTLWLRLMGKGRIQQQAIQEVTQLAQTDTRGQEALRLLGSWKLALDRNIQLAQQEAPTKNGTLTGIPRMGTEDQARRFRPSQARGRI